jgi:hypothetical protein
MVKDFSIMYVPCRNASRAVIRLCWLPAAGNLQGKFQIRKRGKQGEKYFEYIKYQSTLCIAIT